MKRIRIILLAVLLFSGGCAFAQQALFDKWEDAKDVTTVYISKSLLRLMPKGGGVEGFGRIADKIDQLRILTTENAKAAERIRAEAVAYYKKHGYAVAMKVSEGDERITIYQRALGGGRAEFSLVAQESRELSVINVEGTLSLDDIQGVASPPGKGH